jgi:hypothetical protein
MGITIHYNGKINNIAQTDAFISELSSISNEMDWEYTLINDNDLQVKGILAKPDAKSETLSFLFDKSGQLINPIYLIENDDGRLCSSSVHIKTQFSHIDVHVTVIKLLKYVKKKYIDNLQVFDEGGYWETNDRQLLKNRIDFLYDKINSIQKILSELPSNINDTAESIAERIEKVLSGKLSK